MMTDTYTELMNALEEAAIFTNGGLLVPSELQCNINNAYRAHRGKECLVLEAVDINCIENLPDNTDIIWHHEGCHWYSTTHYKGDTYDGDGELVECYRLPEVKND